MGLADRLYMKKNYKDETRHSSRLKGRNPHPSAYKKKSIKPRARREKSYITQTYYNFKRWFFRRKHPYSKLRLDKLMINFAMAIGLVIILLIIVAYLDILNSIAIWFIELGTAIALILLYFTIKQSYNVFVNLRYGLRGLTNGVKLILVVLLIVFSSQAYQVRDDVISPNLLLVDDHINDSSIKGVMNNSEDIITNTYEKFNSFNIEDLGESNATFVQKVPYTSPERKEECKEAFNYLNEIRKNNGRRQLKWDDRAYKLAVARCKDMSERNYFDHVTPEGTCAKDMKSEYGFKFREILAENCGGMTHYVGGDPIPGTNVNETIEMWMSSRGHRYNLLYADHVSGAIGCYKAICIFYGVHTNPYGLGAGPCTTGEEGTAYWESSGKQMGE